MSSEVPPTPDPNKELVGIMTVKQVLFYDNNNGFTIVQGETEKSREDGEKIIFKGHFPEYPDKGQIFCVKGKMGFDAKRGNKTFNLTFCRPQEIKTAQGWFEYLQKECPRVSTARAKELVDNFGVKVVEKLAESPDVIMQAVSTVLKRPFSLAEADHVHNWAKRELRLSRMKAWLYERGLTYSLVNKIVARYGKEAPNIVRTNPYQLIEIDGIGFLTADKVGKAVKIPDNHPARLQAGILFAMQEEIDGSGHTCLPEHKVIEEACKLLGVHHQLITNTIKELVSSGKLCDASSDVKQLSPHPFLFEDVL